MEVFRNRTSFAKESKKNIEFIYSFISFSLQPKLFPTLQGSNSQEHIFRDP